MNWSILPSESQVMSPSTALRVGRCLSRWIGITGNNCLIAQLSGIDWNSEKLQKYVSERNESSPSNSSGMNSKCFASRLILWQIAKYRFSTLLR